MLHDDPRVEAALLIALWERQGLVRARQRIAAQQLGEAFIDLNLPVTIEPEDACVAV